MVTKFENFILNEKSGINDEVVILSKIIFIEYLNNNNLKKVDLPINKLNIKKIIIKNSNENEFNIDKSNKTIIFLKLDLNNLTEDTIYHELNHVLQFKMIGKDQTLINLFKYKSAQLIFKFKKNIEVENFIMFKYYSQKNEIDSFIYNFYKFIKDNIPNDKLNFNKNFEKLLTDSKDYKIYQFLKYYDPHNLKNMNENELLYILNTYEKNYKFLYKYHNNIFHYIAFFFKSIKEALNNNIAVFEPIIKIENLDKYLSNINKHKNISKKYMLNKMTRLYNIIFEETQK